MFVICFVNQNNLLWEKGDNSPMEGDERIWSTHIAVVEDEISQNKFFNMSKLPV